MNIQLHETLGAVSMLTHTVWNSQIFKRCPHPLNEWAETTSVQRDGLRTGMFFYSLKCRTGTLGVVLPPSVCHEKSKVRVNDVTTVYFFYSGSGWRISHRGIAKSMTIDDARFDKTRLS